MSNSVNTTAAVYLPDGSIMTIPSYIFDVRLYTDQKALENPRPGINVFVFVLPANSYYQEIAGPFQTYSHTYNDTRESLFQGNYGCNTTSSIYNTAALCSKLIQLEGWKIPDDYPFKF
jgi:hypothetical protein